ncbi:10832_t:CDS:2 [Ambispora gerdemannii]|uniref:10832_t:CDS:1 n=1 Tax=Ambispora gerdemannii TaxID=144530 RepID=A0A9N9D1Z2_9GLOM|nr:10832_t:CDS:2 [Ambispora gerdemannii]
MLLKFFDPKTLYKVAHSGCYGVGGSGGAWINSRSLLFARYSTFNSFSSSIGSEPTPSPSNSYAQPRQRVLEQSQAQPPSQQPSPSTRANILPQESNTFTGTPHRGNPILPRPVPYSSPPPGQNIFFQNNRSIGGGALPFVPERSNMQKPIPQQPPPPRQKYGQEPSLPSINFQNNPRIYPNNVNYRGHNPNQMSPPPTNNGGPTNSYNANYRGSNPNQMPPPRYNMPSNPGPVLMSMPTSESNPGQMPRYNNNMMLMPISASNPGQQFDYIPLNLGQMPRYTNNIQTPMPMQISESNTGQRFDNIPQSPGQMPRYNNMLSNPGSMSMPRYNNMSIPIPRYNNMPQYPLRPRFRAWTNDEIDRLRKGVEKYGKNFELISLEWFHRIRSARACQMKHDSIQDSIHKLWTSDEVDRLRKGVEKYGKNFELISLEWFHGIRSAKACQMKHNKIQNGVTAIKKHLQDRTTSTSKENSPDKNIETESTNKSDPLDVRLGELFDKELYQINRTFGKSAEKIQIIYDTPSSPNRAWTKKENNILFKSVKELGDDWAKILERLPGQTLASAKSRYGDKVWTLEEITAFDEAFSKHGEDWAKIGENIPTKTAGQCWSYWRRSTGADLPLPNELENSSAKPHRVYISIQFLEELPIELQFIRHHKWEIFTRENATIISTKLNNPIVSAEEKGKSEENDQNTLYITKESVKPVDENKIYNKTENILVFSNEKEKEQENSDLKGEDNDLDLRSDEDLELKGEHDLGTIISN